MGERCIRCEEWVDRLDPHLDCTGPVWAIGYPIPGFDTSRVVLTGFLPDMLRCLRRHRWARAPMRRVERRSNSIWGTTLEEIKTMVTNAKASEKAAEARSRLPAGSSRAKVTTANARWARAAEARDARERWLRDEYRGRNEAHERGLDTSTHILSARVGPRRP